MANKIGPVDHGAVGKVGKKPAEPVADNRISSTRDARGAQRGIAAGAEDTVELTGRAQLLERLEKSLDALSPVDAARVSEIRMAIENGDYKLDSASIAEAMLRFERLLGE